MTRILFVVPHLHGSMRLLANTLRFLDHRKYAVELLVISPEVTLEDEFPPWIRMHVRKGGDSCLDRLRWLLRLLKDAPKHDILVGYSELTPTYLTALAGYLRQKPVIGWVHTSLSQVFRWNLRPYWAHRWFMATVYPRLEKVVAVSEGLADDLRTHFGWPNVLGIRNCIDVKRVQQLAKESLPEDLRLLFEKPVLINVAKLTFQKAQELLLAAHGQLLLEGVDHHLLLVGDGPQREDLERLAKDLGVEGSVHFLGFHSNPYPLIIASRGLVLNSRFEGFGLVLAEALALGVPVVATDCQSGPREILSNGEYGLLVPTEDPDALAAAMKRLLIDETLHSTLCRRGPQRAWHYDCSQVVPELDALFDSVVKRGP